MNAPLWPPHTSTHLAVTHAGCAPGADGIPDGLMGRLLCGDYPMAAWWDTLSARWPLAAAVVATAAAARLAVTWLLRRRWARHAAAATWLEITPPTSASPAATVQLWRLAATLLPAPRWWRKHPTARLVWEVAADPDRLRCGLWIPPGVHPAAVTRVVQRAWPGARVEPAPPPRLPTRPGAAVAGQRLMVTQPQWMPLLDDPIPATPRRPGIAAVWPEEDRQRAVYDGLAAAGRGGGAILQVHLVRAPAATVATLRRATVNPTGQRHRGRRPMAGLLVRLATAVVRGLLDLATGEKTIRPAGEDPYAAQLSAAAKAKAANPPFLIAAVHATAAAATRAAAKAAAQDITGGYALVSAQLARARLHRPATTARRRWAPVTGMFLVNVTEAAALAGLPAEPSAYGLPAAAARTRRPVREVWTPDHTTTTGVGPW